MSILVVDEVRGNAQFQAMLDVHVTAPFRILRDAAEPWRTMSKAEAAEGREVIRKVVNISSMPAPTAMRARSIIPRPRRRWLA